LLSTLEVHDLPYDWWSKDLPLGRRFDEPNQSDNCVKKIGVDRTHIHCLGARIALFDLDNVMVFERPTNCETRYKMWRL
jgi:hypothetical protein